MIINFRQIFLISVNVKDLHLSIFLALSICEHFLDKNSESFKIDGLSGYLRK